MDEAEKNLIETAQKFTESKERESYFRKNMDRFYVLARAELILNLIAPNEMGPAHYIHLKAIEIAHGLGLPDSIIGAMFDGARKTEE